MYYAGDAVNHVKSFPRRNGTKEICHVEPGVLYIVLLIFKNLSENIPTFDPGMSANKFNQIASHSAVQLKTFGNDVFAEGNYEEAIHLYTFAIQLAPEDHPELYIFFSNRSECHLKLNQDLKALEDAMSALKLNPNHDKSIHRKNRAEARMKVTSNK